PQTVLQDRDGKQAEDRSPDGAASAENRGAAENDRGDSGQLIAAAGVGLGLAQVGNVNDGGERGDHTREQIDKRDASTHRNAGIAGALAAEADGVEGAADGGTVE